MAKEKDDLVEEVRSIKLLLVLQLLRQGVRQSQIAALLGISAATMSRMLPKGLAKGVSKVGVVSGADAA